jgi:hypothetical protein
LKGEYEVKKFVIGVFCGLLCSIPTITFANEFIQAVLFPSKISFQINNEKVDLNQQENEVLNYKNKAYIPLRSFSEAMGATVDFVSATNQGDGMNEINITQVSPTIWELKRSSALSEMCTGIPFTITAAFSPGDGESSGDIPIDKINNYQIHVNNYMKENVDIDPMELVIEVYTTDSQGAIGDLIYTHALPPLKGLIPSQFGYDATITWDQIRKDGNKLTPGDYFIVVKRPSQITYNLDGSNVNKTEDIVHFMGCNLSYYRTKFK